VALMPQWDEGGELGCLVDRGDGELAVPGGGDAVRGLAQHQPGSVNLLIKGGYGWPALDNAYHRTILDRPNPFFGGQRYNEVFAAADKQIDDSWLWLPTTASTLDHLNASIAGAVNSRGRLIDALRTAQRQTVDDLRAKGLKASGPKEER
jgi:multiple sugar transport system substrate-binding protein